MGFEAPKTPYLTVDGIIVREGHILLVERKYPPLGWALPGGFVEYGESTEEAIKREINEETGLVVKELELFGVYSKPDRDPRVHTVSVVYICDTEGEPSSGSDAKNLRFFPLDSLPEKIAFDHRDIIKDYIRKKR